MYRDKKRNDKRSIQKKLFVWSLAVIAMTATAAAGAAAAEPPQIIEKFDVEEEFGVRKALAMLGSQCQKNIVPSPGVDGVLAFRSLRNVTFEEALDAILGENFKYEQEGKLIKVYTKDEYKKIKEDPARMEYKVFTLYYITAEEAAKLIAPVLSGSASAKIEKSTAAEKGISASSSGGASGAGSSAGSGSGGNAMALNDTIVVYDYPEYLEKAVEVIKSIDIRPKQVLVEATILSATLTEETKFGIDWNFMAGVSLNGTSSVGQIGTTESIGTTTTTPISQIAAGTAGAPIETAGFATSGMNGLRIGASSGDMALFITALESITDVTILANPKILAVNKQEGYVQIGKKLGYRGSTAISTGGVATQGEVQFLDTGTVLTFRPYIGNDGYIRMDIYPKDSTAQLNVDKVPDETVTQVRTNVIVKDGETIVIGGLFRDVVTTGRSQVPLLGDLPLVGGLFRGTNDRTERQEVIVLLTPHIIEEPGEMDGQARAADISRKRFGAKDELQWMDRAKLAEDHYAKAVASYSDHDTLSAMEQVNASLRLRPTYLEALRLKERIIAESTPEEVQQMERIMLDNADQKEAPKWTRK
ncbi:MAG: secretin N-terminal domain-containing protein [Planctomycetota bacterium]